MTYNEHQLRFKDAHDLIKHNMGITAQNMLYSTGTVDREVRRKSAAESPVAYLEAVCGQFYLTILVASLVGAHISDQNKLNQDNK